MSYDAEASDAARAKHSSTPPGEHIEFRPYTDKPWISCVRCFGIKPAAGWPDRPCRGGKIGLR